jgi:Winged helix-turn helix
MRGRRTSLRVILTSEERNELERRLRCTTTAAGLARRSRVILGVADGLSLVAVARLVGMTEKHVRKWTTRFLKSRLEGLHDRPGRGRKPVFSPRGGNVRGEDRLRATG